MTPQGKPLRVLDASKLTEPEKDALRRQGFAV